MRATIDKYKEKIGRTRNQNFKTEQTSPWKIRPAGFQESFGQVDLPQIKKNKKNLADMSKERTLGWINNVKHDSELLESVLRGSITELNENSFREKSDRANIYVRNFMTSSERSVLKQNEFDQSFLKKGKYDSPKRIIERTVKPSG